MVCFDPLQHIFGERFPLHWQMTLPERLLLISILQQLKPELAIEVGTHLGGSLQVLSKFSRQVISIDCDPETGTRLGNRFANVEYVVGDSADALPAVLKRIGDDSLKLGFALIDGQHSADGVAADLNAFLASTPQSEVVLLVHDSANPECRRGIAALPWEASAHVHYVELDFLPGIFRNTIESREDSASLWGGFACIVLSPLKRTGPLTIGAGYGDQFGALARLVGERAAE